MVRFSLVLFELFFVLLDWMKVLKIFFSLFGGMLGLWLDMMMWILLVLMRFVCSLIVLFFGENLIVLVSMLCRICWICCGFILVVRGSCVIWLDRLSLCCVSSGFSLFIMGVISWCML